jgi:hypothetical protein
MKARLALGVIGLTACSGGSWVRPSPGGSERASSQATEVGVDVAGGETSEFTGGGDPCDEIASSEPLALDDPEVASWVAMVQGHHEQTLGWRRLALSDEVAGFAEHTSVSIDVNVLGAREYVLGSSGPDDELFGCSHRRGRQIELETTLATADGAVATTFRSWFSPGPTGDRGMVLRYYGTTTDGSGPVDLNGTLELGLDPALGGTPLLLVELEFGADSVQGSLLPEVMPEVGDREGAPWWPIEALFPDDGCQGEGRSIGLDESLEAIGGTPRAYYQRMVSARRHAPTPAAWKSKPSNVLPSPKDVPLDLPPPTEVSLSFGEPTRACAIFNTYVTVYAPLTVTTADGRVNLTQPFAFNLSEVLTFSTSEVRGSIVEPTPWVPAADFDEQMGIDGVNLPSGFGSISFELYWEKALIEGRIEVTQWDAFRHRAVAYPVLEWCQGEYCVR